MRKEEEERKEKEVEVAFWKLEYIVQNSSCEHLKVRCHWKELHVERQC
jgi:hypothetical protein